MANRSQNGEEKWSSSLVNLSEAYKRLRSELNNSSQVNDLLSWINGLNSRVRNTLGEQYEESARLSKEEDTNRLRKQRSDSSFDRNLSQFGTFSAGDVYSGIDDNSLKKQEKHESDEFSEGSGDSEVVNPYEKEESKDEDVIEVLSSGESNSSEDEGLNSRNTSYNLDYDLGQDSNNENLNESLWHDVDIQYKRKGSLENESDVGSIEIEAEAKKNENEEVPEKYDGDAESEESQGSVSNTSEGSELEVSEGRENLNISNRGSEVDMREEVEDSGDSVSMTSHKSPNLSEGQQSPNWEGHRHEQDIVANQGPEDLPNYNVPLEQGRHHTETGSNEINKLRIEHFLHDFDTDQKLNYLPARDHMRPFGIEEEYSIGSGEVENWENHEELKSSVSEDLTEKSSDDPTSEEKKKSQAANYFQNEAKESSKAEKDIESDESDNTLLHFKVNGDENQNQIAFGLDQNRYSGNVEPSIAEARKFTEIAEAGLRNFDSNFLNNESFSLNENTISSLAADVAASISYERNAAFELNNRNNNEDNANEEDIGIKITNRDNGMGDLSGTENIDENGNRFPPKNEISLSSETPGGSNSFEASMEEFPKVTVRPQESPGTPVFRTVEDEDSEAEYVKLKETERKFDIQLDITKALEERLKSKGKVSSIIQALEPQYSAPAMSKPVLAPILTDITESDIFCSPLSDTSESSNDFETQNSLSTEDIYNGSEYDRSIFGKKDHTQLPDDNADNISLKSEPTKYGAADDPMAIDEDDKSSESSYGPDIYSNDFMSNSTDFFSGGGMSSPKDNSGKVAGKSNDERYGNYQDVFDDSEYQTGSIYHDKLVHSNKEDSHTNVMVQEPQNENEECNIVFYNSNTVVEASNDDLLQPSAVEEPIESEKQETEKPFTRDDVNLDILDESDIVEDHMDILYPDSVVEPYNEFFSVIEIGNNSTIEADYYQPGELLFPSFVEEPVTPESTENEGVLSRKRPYDSIEDDTGDNSPVKKIKTMMRNIKPSNLLFKANNWVRKYYNPEARQVHNSSIDATKREQIEKYDHDLPANLAHIPVPSLQKVPDSTASEDEGNAKISSERGDNIVQVKDTNTSVEGGQFSEGNTNELRVSFPHNDKENTSHSVPVNTDMSIKGESDSMKSESSQSEKNKDKLVKHRKIFGIDVDDVDLQHEKSLRSGNTYGMPNSADSVEKRKDADFSEKTTQSYFESHENASEVPGLSDSAKSVFLKGTEDLKDYPAFRTRSKSPLKGSMQEILSVVEGEEAQHPRQRRTSTRLQETKSERKEKHSRGRKKN